MDKGIIAIIANGGGKICDSRPAGECISDERPGQPSHGVGHSGLLSDHFSHEYTLGIAMGTKRISANSRSHRNGRTIVIVLGTPDISKFARTWRGSFFAWYENFVCLHLQYSIVADLAVMPPSGPVCAWQVHPNFKGT